MVHQRFINKYDTLIFCVLTIFFYYDYLYTKLFKVDGSGTPHVDLISPPPAITSGYTIEKGGF
jgi:hypothetical protein